MFIPDPTLFNPGSRNQIVSIKEFKYFNPKKWFPSSKKYDPGCSSRIPNPDPDILPIPDPESRGQKGTGSRTRIRNTGCYLVVGPLSLTLRRPVERGWMNTVRQKVADFPHSSYTKQHYHPLSLTLRMPVERGWMNTVRQKVADFPHSSCTTQHYHPLSLTLRRPVERGWMNRVRQKVADLPHSSCTTQHYHLSHTTFHPDSIHKPGPGIRKKLPP
jgi:hypothetical protein